MRTTSSYGHHREVGKPIMDWNNASSRGRRPGALEDLNRGLRLQLCLPSQYVSYYVEPLPQFMTITIHRRLHHSGRRTQVMVERYHAEDKSLYKGRGRDERDERNERQREQLAEDLHRKLQIAQQNARIASRLPSKHVHFELPEPTVTFTG